MHKEDAAHLFVILSVGDRVKILKKLYNKGSLDYVTLQNMFENDIKENLDVLKNAGFIKNENDVIMINKKMVDELMSFIATPCGCNK